MASITSVATHQLYQAWIPSLHTFTAAAMTSKADTVCDASTTQGPADTDADIEEMRRVIFNSEHVEKAGGSDKDSGIIRDI